MTTIKCVIRLLQKYYTYKLIPRLSETILKFINVLNARLSVLRKYWIRNIVRVNYTI